AGERVSCPGRVEDFLERERGYGEDRIRREQDRSVLSALDEDTLRAECQDLPGGAGDVVHAGELAGFLVVDDEDVDAREQRFERTARLVDPMVHRVEADE